MLEQTQVALAVRDVVPRDIEQRPQQHRAQPRLILGERVLDDDRMATLVRAGQAQPVGYRRRSEGPPDRLVQPPPHEHIQRPAVQALRGG